MKTKEEAIEFLAGAAIVCPDLNTVVSVVSYLRDAWSFGMSPLTAGVLERYPDRSYDYHDERLTCITAVSRSVGIKMIDFVCLWYKDKAQNHDRRMVPEEFFDWAEESDYEDSPSEFVYLLTGDAEHEGKR